MHSRGEESRMRMRRRRGAGGGREGEATGSDAAVVLWMSGSEQRRGKEEEGEDLSEEMICLASI